jgi:hypothetical protein
MPTALTEQAAGDRTLRMSTPPPGRTSRRSGRLKPSPDRPGRRTVCQHPPRSVAEEVAGLLAGRPQNRDALVFTAPKGGRTVGPISSGTASSRPSLPRMRSATWPWPGWDGPSTDQRTTAWKKPQVDDPFVWRRLRGSNPRGSCPPTRFPGVCLRPLGQASAAQSSQPRHAPATSRCGRRALDAVWPPVA